MQLHCRKRDMRSTSPWMSTFTADIFGTRRALSPTLQTNPQLGELLGALNVSPPHLLKERSPSRLCSSFVTIATPYDPLARDSHATPALLCLCVWHSR